MTKLLLLQALIFLNLCYSSSGAYLRERYQGQTTAFYFITSTPDYPLCLCANNKCQLDVAKADAVCKMIKRRFLYYTELSPYYIICEINHTPCDQASKEPKYHELRITFEHYHLTLSKFFTGNDHVAKIALDVLKPECKFAHPILSTPINVTKVEYGEVGFPVYFDGVLNVKAEDFGKFKYCETQECVKWIDEFCAAFSKAMDKVEHNLLRFYLGCTIIRAYPSDGNVKLTWAMMFQHRHMIQNDVVKTRKDVENLITKATKDIKIDQLKGYTLKGFRTIDVCEITVSAQTTQDFDPAILDITSRQYLMSTFTYREWIRRRIEFGSKDDSGCVQEVLKFVPSNSDNMLKFTLDAWISIGCARKHGLKDCDAVMQNLQSTWQQDMHTSRSLMTPSYAVKLLNAGVDYK